VDKKLRWRAYLTGAASLLGFAFASPQATPGSNAVEVRVRMQSFSHLLFALRLWRVSVR
jgi:hypothetical protein